MPKRVQILNHDTTDSDAFVGREAELTVDTGAVELRVHDGSTAGGARVAKADAVVLRSAFTGNNQFLVGSGNGTFTAMSVGDVRALIRRSDEQFFNVLKTFFEDDTDFDISDANNTISVTIPTGGGATAEEIFDVVKGFFADNSPVDITINDTNNTIDIALTDTLLTTTDVDARITALVETYALINETDRITQVRLPIEEDWKSGDFS